MGIPHSYSVRMFALNFTVSTKKEKLEPAPEYMDLGGLEKAGTGIHQSD